MVNLRIKNRDSTAMLLDQRVSSRYCRNRLGGAPKTEPCPVATMAWMSLWHQILRPLLDTQPGKTVASCCSGLVDTYRHNSIMEHVIITLTCMYAMTRLHIVSKSLRNSNGLILLNMYQLSALFHSHECLIETHSLSFFLGHGVPVKSERLNQQLHPLLSPTSKELQRLPELVSQKSKSWRILYTIVHHKSL
jgi:hypothetical protein